MEELIPTLQEEGEERIDTLQEGSIIAGVQTINGKAGDLDLKTINGQDILTPGNLSLATTEQLATKQDALTETQLDAVNSGIDATKVQQIADNTTAIAGKQDQLTQTQLNAVNSGIDETKVAQIATNTGNITSNTGRIAAIEGKIPSTATSENKLTDKNYVDNAIATNTANYISDNGQPFQSYDDLVAYSGPLTNNDYAFVETIDSAGNDIYTRYKYNADQNLWAEEYTITNPYFTSDQWASINSGIAANDVTQIGTNKSDIASLQSGKQDALSQTQLDAVNSGIDATKVQQIATNAGNITSLQTDKQDKLIAGTNIQIAADGKTISATDTTYTAGTGLTLTGTQFSVTEPVPTGFFTDTAATQKGTGTTITLNNTVDAPIDNVELKGDTFQQTYSGNNLFNINDLVQISYTTYDADGWATCVVDNSEGTGAIYAQFRNSVIPSTVLPLDTECTAVCEIKSLSGYGTINIINAHGQSQFQNSIAKTFEEVSAGDVIIGTARTKTDYTGASTCMRTFITVPAGNVVSITYRLSLIIGTGITPQNFEYQPYVGGIPSPNPDYPQDIQVVTGEQTITVVGKNLLARTAASENKLLTWAAGAEANETGSIASDYIQAESGNEFWLNYSAAVFFYDTNKTYLGHLVSNGNLSFANTEAYFSNFSVPSGHGIVFVRLVFRVSKGGNPADMTTQNIMVNTGTALLPFSKYAQSYTIDLGATELCKIGVDQDYIYKDGSDWKVHREIGKLVLTGANDEEWTVFNSGADNFYYRFRYIQNAYQASSTTRCDKFIWANIANANTIPGFSIINTDQMRFRWGAEMSISDLRVWLAANNITVYYGFVTPTDTAITDAALISQLEALANSTTYAPQTNYTTSTASPNLPTILTVDVFKNNYAGLLARLNKAGA